MFKSMGLVLCDFSAKGIREWGEETAKVLCCQDFPCLPPGEGVEFKELLRCPERGRGGGCAGVGVWQGKLLCVTLNGDSISSSI